MAATSTLDVYPPRRLTPETYNPLPPSHGIAAIAKIEAMIPGILDDHGDQD